MANVSATARELPPYSEYTRFGPGFRNSPESLNGSRISAVSNSRAKGCWCSYPWIFLLLILIIVSLIASNLSIYFLMKDGCDANMAKMEREMMLDELDDGTANPPLNVPDNKPPGAWGMTSSTAVHRPLIVAKATTTNAKLIADQQENENNVSTKTSYQTSSSQQYHKVDISTESGDEKISTTNEAPINSDLIKFQTTRASSNLGAAVAGILQLEATIRIPQEQDVRPSLSSVNPAIEEYFDLARYFSIKASGSTKIVEDNFNKQTSLPNFNALISQQDVYDDNNEQDYLADTVIDNFQQLTRSPIQIRSLEPDEYSDSKEILSSAPLYNEKASTPESISLQRGVIEENSIISPFVDNNLENFKIIPSHRNTGIINDTVEDYLKLTDDLVPYSYVIEWRPHLDPGPNQLTFDGFVLIDFQCRKSSNEIFLNAKDLNIDQRSTTIIEKNNFTNSFRIVSLQINEYSSMLLFTLNEPLRQGYNYSFGTRFSGKMSYNTAGLSYIDYADGNTKKYKIR